MTYFDEVLKLLKQIQIDQTGSDQINRFIQEAQDFANEYNAPQSIKDEFIIYFASAKFLKNNGASDPCIFDTLFRLYIKLINL